MTLLQKWNMKKLKTKTGIILKNIRSTNTIQKAKIIKMKINMKI